MLYCSEDAVLARNIGALANLIANVGEFAANVAG
jgi:hypothetical protein